MIFLELPPDLHEFVLIQMRLQCASHSHRNMPWIQLLLISVTDISHYVADVGAPWIEEHVENTRDCHLCRLEHILQGMWSEISMIAFSASSRSFQELFSVPTVSIKPSRLLDLQPIDNSYLECRLLFQRHSLFNRLVFSCRFHFSCSKGIYFTIWRS